MEQSNDFASGVNWLATGSASLVIGLIMGILGNLLTDPVKNRLVLFNFNRTKKRIDELEIELQKIGNLVNNPNELHLNVFSSITYIILITLLAFVINNLYESVFSIIQPLAVVEIKPKSFIYIPKSLYVIGQFISSVLYIIVVIEALSIYKLIRNVQGFPKYKEEINKIIKNLSDNMADKKERKTEEIKRDNS